uniref:Uncharacterized protein n=1 Tax=Anguilla anguilla TaxID=7936 RepID=A0A0E9RZW9_ANGAN
MQLAAIQLNSCCLVAKFNVVELIIRIQQDSMRKPQCEAQPPEVRVCG